MGLPDPYDTAAYDADLARITVGSPTPLAAQIEVRDYDPAWPVAYEREAARVTRALGERARRLEHVGSTSVPGLPAKPIIDIVLEVPDSADEPAYVPDLEATGYALRIREPDWFEHRMFKGPDTDINLHVFTAGAAEIDKMLLFRDWLRTCEPDRDAYLKVKRELAQRAWRHVQHYADAKSAIVEQIVAHAAAARQPRRAGPAS